MSETNPEPNSDDSLELVPSKPSAHSEQPPQGPVDGMAPPLPPPPPPGSPPPAPVEAPDPYKVDTTPDDRTFGLVSHLSLLVCCVGPVGIYFTKGKDSKFIRFHAIQATLWMLLSVLVISPMLGITAWRWVASDLVVVKVIPHLSLVTCISLFFTVYSIYVGMGAYKSRLTEYLIIGPYVRKKIYGDTAYPVQDE